MASYYHADEIIVLYGNFKTKFGKSTYDVELEPNEKYNNWKYVLIRNKGQ